MKLGFARMLRDILLAGVSPCAHSGISIFAKVGEGSERGRGRGVGSSAIVL